MRDIWRERERGKLKERLNMKGVHKEMRLESQSSRDKRSHVEK